MTKNILIIDDSAIARTLIKQHLKCIDDRIIVQEASNGEDGISMIKNDDFDTVILDYTMPGKDGIDVLRKIYDTKTDSMPCPIIMLTGQKNVSVIMEAFDYGLHDYLIKDNITKDTLYIALIKAQKMHELNKSRKTAEQQLVQSQKMEAIGALTGGIAHDFNNLLTIIFGNAKLLSHFVNDPDRPAEQKIKTVQAIEKAAQRGADLVKRMMIFSRQKTLTAETTNINDLVSDMSDMLQRSLGDMIDIKTSFTEDLWSAHIDPVMLEHALINLAVNARDAMPDGGTLKITTKNIIVDDSSAHKVDISPGSYTALIVSDTGTGMPKDVCQKIFDPFFTTKEAGKGTGLGLSMVYGFITESGGAINVDSRMGQGTAFSIFLPRAVDETSHAIIEDDGAEEAARGREVILLVEDEEEINHLSCAILESHGYTVLSATTGMEALNILTKTDEHIELLFTDIAMPGEMNGIQLAGRAQAIQPSLKLLFTTGYAGNSIPDMALIEDYPLLNKPYQPADVLEKVRAILDLDTEAA